MKAKACENCWTMFRPNRSTAKYCSSQCRQEAYRKRHGIPGWKCKHCHAVYYDKNPLEVACPCGRDPQVLIRVYILPKGK